MIKRISLITAAVVLAGCSAFSNDEDKALTEPMPLEKIKATASLKKVWSFGAGDQGKYYGTLRPAIDGGSIYVANIEGEVTALDAAAGKQNWQSQVDVKLSGGVGVDDNQVLVGGFAGQLIALDRQTGAERWRAQLSSEIIAAPASDGDVVVAVAVDGRTFGLNANTGAEIWRFDTSLPTLTVRGDSTPIIVNSTVYVGLANGQVAAIDASNGSVRWMATVALPKGTSDLSRIVDIDGDLLIEQNVMYAASYQGQVMAIDMASGRGIWADPASTFHGVASGFGNVYVVEDNSLVRSMNASNGTQTWQNEQLLRRKLGQPLAVGNYLLSADYEGYIHLISQVDGTIAGRTKAGGAVTVPLMYSQNLVYVLNSKGQLTAYELRQ